MELWDIYDENKMRTGRTMRRNDWQMQPSEFHLTVLGIVQHTDGRYLVTLRRNDKEWGAGWWEVPGGGVRAGEDSFAAVQREVREETGLDISAAKGGYVFTYKRVNPSERNNYFVDVYKFTLPFDAADVHVQESEVAGFRLATLEEIQACAASGKFLHYDSIKRAFGAKVCE